MFKRTLTKPDGRTLELYSRRPIPERLDAPSPEESSTPPNPHLRWHPLRGMDRLRWIAAEPHVSSSPAVQPARADDDPANPTEPAGSLRVRLSRSLLRAGSMARLSSSDGPPDRSDVSPHRNGFVGVPVASWIRWCVVLGIARICFSTRDAAGRFSSTESSPSIPRPNAAGYRTRANARTPLRGSRT